MTAPPITISLGPVIGPLPPVTGLSFEEMPPRLSGEYTPTASDAELNKGAAPRLVRYLATGQPLPVLSPILEDIELFWLPPQSFPKIFATYEYSSNFPIIIGYLSGVVPEEPGVKYIKPSMFFCNLFTSAKVDSVFGTIVKLPIPGEHWIQNLSPEMCVAINRFANKSPVYISYRPVVRILPNDITVGEIKIYTNEGLEHDEPAYTLPLHM
jgi:hypothetical protein